MLKFLKPFILASLVCFLAACGSSKLAPLNSNDIIVAFGDSLTAGVGTDESDSYPSVLEQLISIEVINAGISGETTSEGLERLPEVIEEHNPSLLILIEGGNDILRNVGYSTIENNLDQMIQIAMGASIPVVLIGIPEKSLFSSSAPFYHKLAEKYQLPFDSDLIASLMRSPSKKSDPIHFNREGYRAMAEGIQELLVESGALN